jgi:cation diffusion facilitator family transporter
MRSPQQNPRKPEDAVTARGMNRCCIVIETSAAERKTAIVTLITIVMMVVEILTGIMSGSIALLADGLHMGSHAIALGVSYIAYVYARRNAANPRFTFGTGKVNALAGYTGAILLVLFAVWMTWDSIERLLHPVTINYSDALLVAAIGLIVNALCAVILQHDSSHAHGHEHGQGDHPHAHDHNLQAAYLHVLADAATSVTAIAALLAARYLHTAWMDPLMGLVGAVLVTTWSTGLIKRSSAVLLDHDGPGEIRETIEASLDGLDIRITDFHCWALAPGRFAVILSLATNEPKPAGFYRSLLPRLDRLVHLTIEVNGVTPNLASQPLSQ